jgi:phosphoglycerate dehydrogenase-like enzyme
MTLHVHLLGDVGDDAVAVLRDGLDPDVALTVGTGPVPSDCRVLVCGRPDKATALGLEHLERLVVPWAGIPPVIREIAAARPDVHVHNLHHNGASAAETAVALLLAAAKHLIPHDRALRADDWSLRYGPSPSLTLEGRTALVLGYGAIGRRVARACRGLGMRVLATRRTITSPAGEDGVDLHPRGALAELLPRADALIVTLPLTDETTGLIGAAELASLPPGAVLVNVGRGPIVDEQALYEALRSGGLGAAGIDVWYQYPKSVQARVDQPPSRFPFGDL